MSKATPNLNTPLTVSICGPAASGKSALLALMMRAFSQAGFTRVSWTNPEETHAMMLHKLAALENKDAWPSGFFDRTIEIKEFYGKLKSVTLDDVSDEQHRSYMSDLDKGREAMMDLLKMALHCIENPDDFGGDERTKLINEIVGTLGLEPRPAPVAPEPLDVDWMMPPTPMAPITKEEPAFDFNGYTGLPGADNGPDIIPQEGTQLCDHRNGYLMARTVPAIAEGLVTALAYGKKVENSETNTKIASRIQKMLWQGVHFPKPYASLIHATPRDASAWFDACDKTTLKADETSLRDLLADRYVEFYPEYSARFFWYDRRYDQGQQPGTPKDLVKEVPWQVTTTSNFVDGAPKVDVVVKPNLSVGVSNGVVFQIWLALLEKITEQTSMGIHPNHFELGDAEAAQYIDDYLSGDGRPDDDFYKEVLQPRTVLKPSRPVPITMLRKRLLELFPQLISGPQPKPEGRELYRLAHKHWADILKAAWERMGIDYVQSPLCGDSDAIQILHDYIKRDGAITDDFIKGAGWTKMEATVRGTDLDSVASKLRNIIWNFYPAYSELVEANEARNARYTTKTGANVFSEIETKIARMSWDMTVEYIFMRFSGLNPTMPDSASPFDKTGVELMRDLYKNGGRISLSFIDSLFSPEPKTGSGIADIAQMLSVLIRNEIPELRDQYMIKNPTKTRTTRSAKKVQAEIEGTRVTATANWQLIVLAFVARFQDIGYPQECDMLDSDGVDIVESLVLDAFSFDEASIKFLVSDDPVKVDSTHRINVICRLRVHLKKLFLL